MTATEDQKVPFRSAPMRLKPEWIDYNGHLNLAYYHVLFDQGIDGLFAAIGLGELYRAATGFTTYTAEAHVSYLKELPPDSAVTVSSQIVGLDTKRLHIFQEMHHTDGWLAATLENLSLSIDQRNPDGPKVAPFPTDVFEQVSRAAKEHARLPRPEQLGRSIRDLGV
ncbi:thioesterase family protein [Aurantimonas sp. VKM B-3413]|uniref:thioesterase family protein n=1 Tax=Aurantimonas sp. VKM B-3413 TaxID=2779401 RepID=UPI001E522FAB|nr:thioesterase family protein [Aurantimonas sp. VKM B-3413]MCB8835888.1 thioesterase family protein [Aurantimonas sp. VKM B-3413]